MKKDKMDLYNIGNILRSSGVTILVLVVIMAIFFWRLIITSIAPLVIVGIILIVVGNILKKAR